MLNRDRQAELLALAGELRPDLHRYCARLMGSVIDGEDVVQDTLIRAFVALQGLEEAPALRPWLFRIAHNRALTLSDVRRPLAIVCAGDLGRYEEAYLIESWLELMHLRERVTNADRVLEDEIREMLIAPPRIEFLTAAERGDEARHRRAEPAGA